MVTLTATAIVAGTRGHGALVPGWKGGKHPPPQQGRPRQRTHAHARIPHLQLLCWQRPADVHIQGAHHHLRVWQPRLGVCWQLGAGIHIRSYLFACGGGRRLGVGTD